MRNLIRPAALTAIVVVLAACSRAGGGAGSPLAGSTPPSPPPTVNPSPSAADTGRLDHPTGATDVILRMDQGGGFVAPSFLASQAPVFSLFGDGTVIFRDPVADPLPPVGGTIPNRPFKIAKLSEDQIQQTLRLAIGQGGLATANATYADHIVADAGTTTFTIDTGDLRKTVSVYALGIESPGSTDASARAAFLSLAQRLGAFDQGGAIKSDDWAPDRYRATLLDGIAGDQKATDWPWKDLEPRDFTAVTDPNAMPMPTHTLTANQAAALGVASYQGGFQNLTLAAPNTGKVYSLALRPLLPDETR